PSLPHSFTPGEPYTSSAPLLSHSYPPPRSPHSFPTRRSSDLNNTNAAPAYASGDTNSDGKLQVTETWTFTAVHTVTQADLDAGTVARAHAGTAATWPTRMPCNAGRKTAHATQTPALSLSKSTT